MVKIAQELKELPLEYVIAAPMQGAVKAQSLAAKSTVDFINNVCVTEKGGNKVVNMVDFIYSKPKPNNDGLMGGMTSSHKLSVPLMTMIPVPYIRIEKMTTHFDFKISSTIIEKDHKEKKVFAHAKYNAWFASASIHGHVGSSHDVDDKLNREANLKIDVTAVQDQMPQGLSKVLDIFTEAIKDQEKSSKSSEKDDSLDSDIGSEASSDAGSDAGSDDDWE